MLLVALAIHAADPIIMTNTSLDLKLSLYPAESSEEGAIVFWTNKGKIERWSVTTASGKNYKMPVKRQYVVKQDGITKYMVKSSLNKDAFIKVFKNDLPVSVSFQIKVFANGQYATIDLPQGIKNYFASELANFNRPKQTPQTSTPSDVIKFMGIPLWGDIETFAKQLEAKGWKFKEKLTSSRNIDGPYSAESWRFEGKFWELNDVKLVVELRIESNQVCRAWMHSTYFSNQLNELCDELSKRYGKCSYDYNTGRWEWKVGSNSIKLSKSRHPDRGMNLFSWLFLSYENKLEKENTRIIKETEEKSKLRRKAEQESQRRRANQDL